MKNLSGYFVSFKMRMKGCSSQIKRHEYVQAKIWFRDGDKPIEHHDAAPHALFRPPFHLAEEGYLLPSGGAQDLGTDLLIGP